MEKILSIFIGLAMILICCYISSALLDISLLQAIGVMLIVNGVLLGLSAIIKKVNND